MKFKKSTYHWKIQHDFQSMENSKKNNLYLYDEWIKPFTYKSLCKNKNVLEAGSGGGIQSNLIAKYAKRLTCVDLESITTTIKNTKKFSKKITYVKADIMKMKLNKKFDVIICVGVLHHTDVPKKTFENLVKHLKKNGVILLWVYSKEGNYLMANIIEPFREYFLSNASHKLLWNISLLLNSLIYPISHILFRIPLFKFVPYYDYLKNSNNLTFKRNALNIYDKLNAHQQYFISKNELLDWFKKKKLKNITLSSYLNVSWRISGKK